MPTMANDNEWDETFPQDDVDLEGEFASLETAESFATTEMKNASSVHETRSMQLHGRQKVGGPSENHHEDSSLWLEWVLSTVSNQWHHVPHLGV